MNLNRKAMVFAVGAALAAPCAQAQVKSKADSDWEFYGKFYPELTHQSGKDATPAGTAVSSFTPAPTGAHNTVSRWEMQVNNSYIGFRGGKDLGSGLRGIWQLETAVAIDQFDGDPLGNRDTFAGLSGGFGTLRLGNMDTPFKKAGDELSFLGVSSGNFVSSSNVMRKIGLSNSSAASFHLRRSNAVDYRTPDLFGGLSLGAQYSVGNPDEATTITQQRKPKVMSLAAIWQKGSWYFAAAHEIHYQLFGGSSNSPAALQNTADPNVSSKDTATQLTAQYKIGAHAFEVDVNTKKYKETPTASGKFVNYKNNAYQLVWTARWSSQWRTAVHFLKATAGSCEISNASCTTTGLDGSQISAGVGYYLDPNFSIFGLYSLLRNGTSARFENLEASGSAGRPAPGEDLTQVAVGLSYTF